MLDFRFKLNPAAHEIAACSTLLNGAAARYRVDAYRTTLAVKAVQRGAALYMTRGARQLVTPGAFLILNEGQEYSLEFQWPSTTETLCPFFQPGFVEHVAYCRRTPVRQQLDDLDPAKPSLEFCERLYARKGRVGKVLDQLHAGVKAGCASAVWLEDRFHELAGALVELHGRVLQEVENVGALRAATRHELYRRLYRGRDYLSSCYASPITVASAARAARLSPAHFHRQFKALFRQTPMQFLQQTRLDAARKLLATTDEPVTTVCFMVGLESLGSFCSLFHGCFGRSPGDYRSAQKSRRKKQS
jgi:AraC family transcriptional regulator